MVQPRPTLRVRSAAGSSPPGAELIGRIAARDEQGMVALYEACARRVFGLAIRIVGDRHAAEDVVVDTFAQVWERAATYHAGRGSVLAWVLSITRSRALDRRRRMGDRRTSHAEIVDLAAAVVAREARPDDVSASAERERRVRAATAALPRGQREALAAAFFAGLSHAEIAAALQIPLGTVKSRIRDGLLALRRALSGALEEHA